jgi:hypothetical protein
MAKQIKPPVDLAPRFATSFSGYGQESAFKDSKYARTLNVGENAEEVMAQEQGFWDTTGNILGRFAGRTALSVADTGAMLTAGLYTAISEGRISGLYDNSISKKLEEINKSLVEATPFYQTEEEKQAKFFSSDIGTVLTSSSFWGNALGEGLGFVAGAAVGGMGTGFALKVAGAGLKSLRGIVSASRMGTAMAAASEEISGIKGFAEALKIGKLGEKIESTLKNRSIRDAAQFYTQKTVSSMYEAGVEARSIKEQLMEKKMAEFKSNYGENAKPSEAQLKEWEEEVDPYANVGFAINSLVLQFDGIGVDKLFKGYTATRRAVNVARQGEKYIEPSRWRKAMGTASSFTGAGKEALQEGLQYSVEKGITGMLSDKDFGQRSLSDWYQAAVDGMSETFGSKEGQESIIIGALLGAKGSAVDAWKQSKLNKDGLSILSNNLTSDRLAPLFININKEVTENKGNKTEDFAATANKYLFRTAQDDNLFKLVKSRVDTGRMEDLYDDLRARKSMPVEEFNKMHGTEFTDAKRHQAVDEVIKSANKIAKTIDNVENSYSKHPFKNSIIKLIAAVSSYTKRISEIQGKLSTEDNMAEREILGSDLAFLIEDKKIAEETLFNLIKYKEAAKEEPKPSSRVPDEESKPSSVADETSTETLEETEDTFEDPVEEETSVSEEETEETKTEEDSEEFVENILINRDRKGEVVKVDGQELTIDGKKEDGLFVGSSESGKIIFAEEEIEREDSVTELDTDTPEEREHVNTELEPDEFPTSDAEDMSFMMDPANPKGGHFNWSDFQLKDNDTFVRTLSENYIKGLTEENKNKILESQKKALTVKNGIINSLAELKKTHKLLVRKDGNNFNVYALNNDTLKETHIGYFLNKTSKVQNTGGKTIIDFFTDYFKTKHGKEKLIKNSKGKNALSTIIEGWQKLMELTSIKDAVDITPFVRMISKIDNIVKGEKRTLFNDIVSNPELSERWKINEQYVIIANSNGSYAPVVGLSKENAKLAREALGKPGAVNSIGTQYAILVKRPDSNAYQFIGLKGRDLTDVEKKKYSDSVKKFNNTPIERKNLQEANKLVNELNEKIFLAYNEEVTLEDGRSYPTHLKFKLTKSGKIITIRIPKIIEGKPQEGVSFSGQAFKGPKVLDAIEKFATVRLTKTDKRTKDITFLTTQYLSTNVRPTLWDTRFRFDHDKFLENNITHTNNDFVSNEPPTEFPDQEEVTQEDEAQNIAFAKSIYRRIKNSNEEGIKLTPKEEEIWFKYNTEELINEVDEEDSKGVRNLNINIKTEEEANEDEGSDANFKIAEDDESNLVELNQDDVRNALKQVTGLDVVFRTDLRERKGAFGVFHDGIIYLNSKVPKGTEWHEAFHAVFSILSKEEQSRILKIAFNKWGVSRDEALRFIQAYADRLNIDVLASKGKDWVISKILEEKIADHFQEFMVDNKKPTILESFFEKLKKLVNWLFDAVQEPSFQSFFTKVAEGNYKNYKYDSSKKTGNADVMFKLVEGFTNEKESNNFITKFITLYKNRKDSRILEIYPEFEEATDEINKIGPFVDFYMEILRKNSAQKVENTFDEFDRILQNPNSSENDKRKVEEDLSEFIKTLENEYYKDATGRYIPLYLKPVNAKRVVDEIKRRKDLKAIIEEEYTEEDEKTEVYGKHEMEVNQKIQRASKSVRNIIDGLFFVDSNGDIKILNGAKYMNNLMYNFSDISNTIERIKENGEEIILNAYEERLKELSTKNTDFSKGVKEILNLFQTDASFRAQFYTAFDNRFVPAIIMVNNGKTRENGNRVMTVNKKDHIYNQMNNWKNQSFNSTVDKNILLEGERLEDVGKALGIEIENDTYLDEQAQSILEQLYNAITFLQKDTLSYDFIKDSTITELLNALAEVNIKYSLELQDLNFKNSKNKSMYSIMQNSFALNELSRNGVEYAIFAGSKFSKAGSDNKFDYNDLDPRSFFLTTLGIYQNDRRKSGDIIKYDPYFFITQFESKSTNFVFRGKDYSKENTSNEEILKVLNDEKVRQDENILKAENNLLEKPLKNLVEDYHYFKGQTKEQTLELLNKFKRGEFNKEADRYYTREDLPRGYRYNNLPFANTKPSTANVVTIEDYNEMLNKQYENIKEFMEDTNIEFGRDIFNEFNLGAGINEEVYFKDFLASQYLNRMQVLAIISPDLNQFKDFVDITKRGAGLLASGPSHYNPEGPESFTFAIFDDIMIDGAKSTDGQAAESISERIYRYTTLGIIAPTTSTITETSNDMELGYIALKAFENDDRELIAILEDDNALLKVDKTVGYGEDFYMKTSVVTIVRYDTSEFAEEGETVTREIDGVMQTFTAFQDINNGRYYLPYPGKEKAWKLLNEMQINRGTEENPKYIKTAFAKSAIKKGIRSVVPLGTDISNEDLLEFSYKNYRLQQENPSGKKKIRDGSQLIQLIDAYFSQQITLNGEKFDVNNISNQMDTLISRLKDYGYNFYGEELRVIIDGKVYDPFLDYVTAAMQGSGVNDRISEFFEVDPLKGEMLNDPNLPMIKVKYEEYILSYFNKHVSSHKVPGNKSTLVSSSLMEGKRIKETKIVNGQEVEVEKTLTQYEYDNLSTENKRKVYSSRLKWITKDAPYAEAIVSEEWLDQMDIDIEEWIRLKNSTSKEDMDMFEKISTAIAYRIPTQSQHSMVPIRIVDIVPRSYGSTIYLPAEITTISGADYDVDSVFIHRHALYKKGDKLVSYENNQSSYKRSLITNEIVRDVISYMEPAPEKKELSLANKNLKKEIDNVVKVKSQLYTKYIETGRADRNEKQLVRYDKLVNDQNEKIKALKLQIKANKDKIKELDALRFEEAIALINSGKETKISPTFISEDRTMIPETAYNKLLDLRMKLLTSEEGVKLINSPAVDLFEDVYNIKKNNENSGFFEKAGYPTNDSEKGKFIVYSGQDNMLNEFKKVSTGAKAIGGSANINKIAAFLQKNGIELSDKTIESLEELYPSLTFSSASAYESDLEFKMDGVKISYNYEVTKNNRKTTISSTRLKSDLLSSLVSITVDNAKEQRLVQLHLTDKNISEASVLAMLGFGKNRLTAFLLSPISEVISNKLNTSDTGISEFAEYKPNGDKIQEFINLMEAKNAKKVDITDAKLISSIQTYEENKRIQKLLTVDDYSTLSKKDQDLVNTQYSLALLYKKISDITSDAYEINRILNFNIKIGRKGTDIAKILGSFKKIGNEKFSFQSSKILSNIYCDKVKDICGKLEKNVAKKLYSYSPNINRLTDALLYSTSYYDGEDAEESYPTKKFKQTVNDAFVEFLGTRLFFAKAKELDFLSSIDLYDENIVNGNNIIQAYNDAREELQVYSIAKLFEIHNYKEIKKPTEKYPFPRVGIDTFNNVSPDDEEMVVTSFDAMMRSKNPKIVNFRNQLMAHIAAHDNFKYTSGSIVGKLRSKYFSKLNRVYKEDLRNIIFSKEADFNKTFKDAFGQEHYEVMRDFIKFFFIDKRNKRKVKQINDSLFTYKDANGESVRLDPIRISNTTYVVEVPFGVKFNNIITPTVFKEGKEAAFIKNLVQFNIPSVEDPQKFVTSITYEFIPGFKTAPKVVTMQYPFEKFYSLIEKYRSLIIAEASDTSDLENMSDENDGVSSQDDENYGVDNNENNNKFSIPNYIMDNILSLTSVQDINSEIKRLTAENYVFSESQIETIKVKRNGLQPSQTEEERPVAQGETPKEYTEFKENTSDEEVATGFSSLGDELGTFSEEDEENLDSDRQQEIRNEADIDPNLDPDLEKYKTVEEAYRIRSLADALFSKIINNFDDNYYQLNKAGEQLGMDIESVQDIKNMSINDRLRLLDNICK